MYLSVLIFFLQTLILTFVLKGNFAIICQNNVEVSLWSSEYEKMIAGDFYRPADPELRALAKASREKQEAFNQEVDP